MVEPAKPTVPLPPAAAPAPPKTVYVVFSAEINPHTTESLIAVAAKYATEGVKELYLLFASPGGGVAQGINLYLVLRGMPFKLTTHNVGNVDSIGNVIFLAGETRYATPHSTFMFHGVGFDGVAGLRMDEKLLRERLGSVLSDQGRIAGIIAERTQLEKTAIEEFFREAQTKDATFAASCGIVHEIRDVQIPPGSPVVSLVFQR